MYNVYTPLFRSLAPRISSFSVTLLFFTKRFKKNAFISSYVFALAFPLSRKRWFSFLHYTNAFRMQLPDVISQTEHQLSLTSQSS